MEFKVSHKKEIPFDRTSNKLTLIISGLYNTQAYVRRLEFRSVKQILEEGGKAHEDDISAKEEAAQEGARLQKKNENKEW